jgi:hypothetical protein
MLIQKETPVHDKPLVKKLFMYQSINKIFTKLKSHYNHPVGPDPASKISADPSKIYKKFSHLRYPYCTLSTRVPAFPMLD